MYACAQQLKSVQIEGKKAEPAAAEKKERAPIQPADKVIAEKVVAAKVEQPAAAKDDRPVFQQLAEVFNNMEILTLMKGDLANVKDVAKRCQEFLKKLMGSRTTKQFAKECVTQISECLLVPDSLIDQVGDFDPIESCSEILD